MKTMFSPYEVYDINENKAESGYGVPTITTSADLMNRESLITL